MHVSWLLPVLALLACRDTPEPFSNDDYGPRVDTGAVRLTYNPGTDQSPTWSPAGDTVYYSARSFATLPIVSGGVLLAVPRNGGTARILLQSTQLNVPDPRWLTTPAVTDDGGRVAFFDLNVIQLRSCATIECPLLLDTTYQQPELVSARLHVRELHSFSPDVAVLDVPLAGRELIISDSIDVLRVHAFPFQRRFSEFRVPAFRPAWAPNGQQIVYSNGVELLLWSPGAAAPQRINGTADALWPAWSPDGQFIAFTRFARVDSVTQTCLCRDGKGFLLEYQRRTSYTGNHLPGTLVLVRPDGTARRELGEGEAPAWLPDGSAVIVRRGSVLQRVNVTTGVAEQIPGTTDGHAPAVSADGNYLAFARWIDGHDWDIWAVPLRGN